MRPVEPSPPASPSSHKAEWATLQGLVLDYLGVADEHERQALRERIAGHIAGVFFVCLDDLAKGKDGLAGDEAGARLERRDSKLERLIKDELRRHRRTSGGQRSLQAAHGGTDAFAPVAAQAFMEERLFRAPGATFISALITGWDGTGTLEGFMRRCVRHFLADMAKARRPVPQRGPRIPKDATPQEAARLQARHEQRQAIYRGEAPLLEEQLQGDVGDDGIDAEMTSEASAQDRPEQGRSATEWAVELQRFRRIVDQTLGRMDPLNAALLRQGMGWEPEEEGQALAQRFGVSPSAVTQRRATLIKELRRALRVEPSN